MLEKDKQSCKKETKDMGKYLPEEELQMTNKNVKRCSNSLIARETQN